ncbi:hypothetical protein IWX76_000598 [Pedobacter sp. CAN_A7]|uniref:family 16 glycoside hydrolase n=1 Tax=Pedobacter sp. CAN_A7 TaxID=2787722 RepID=UPI0018C92E79
MNHIKSLITICLFLSSGNLYAQFLDLKKDALLPVQVSMSVEKLNGKNVVKVIKDSTVKAFDEPTFVRIKESDFKNGTIEIKVLSRLLKNAPEFSRGFIGIAFRINDDNSKFESIYLRPTNARAEDQVRRNHSIQYYAYPNYKFDRLRKEAPEAYESYADMNLNEWIRMKIVVEGKTAKLYLNDNKQPSLIVNDLKLGPDASGAIGLFVDVGTEGFFRDLKIHKQE